MNSERTILNVNDAKLNGNDCRIILKDIHKVDVVLNQFSLAGYSGLRQYEKYLPIAAEQILQNVYQNHIDLGAKVTIPFASFIYFSTTDNKYMNSYANKPRDVHQYLQERKQTCVVLFPGESYELDQCYDSSCSLARYEEAYSKLGDGDYELPKLIELEKITTAFRNMASRLHQRYPKALFLLLKPTCVYMPDLEKRIVFSFRDGTFREAGVGDSVDLVVHSQPLYFGFQYPWGMQTLGVSARLTLLKNFNSWRYHRVLFALNNAELYLTPRFLFTAHTLRYIRKRLAGFLSQVIHRLKNRLT
jgi:hypothetical protein